MLFEVNNLSVRYSDFTLKPVSFQLDRGEILAVIGESGSGKTTLAKAVTCLLDPKARVSGTVTLDQWELTDLPERELRKLRMTEFSIAFQNSAQFLNPTMTLRKHLEEILDRKYPRRQQNPIMQALMEEVGLDARDLDRYPRELSGGMAQKFLLASAVALRPKLVLLDEPTSSLDAASGEEFVGLIRRLNREHQIAFLMITHDMKLASQLSSRILVLYAGQVMETGKTAQVLDQPRHPYTRGLLGASIHLNIARDIWGIPVGLKASEPGGCPFYDRCTQSIAMCAKCAPEIRTQTDGRGIACHRGGIVKVLEGCGITKAYGKQQVLTDCCLDVSSGEVIALVGKSGVGKTTLARILSGFDAGEYRGEVRFEGEIADFTRLHKSKQGVQMVFQDSEASLNPHMTVFDAVSEPLLLYKAPEQEIISAVDKALADVGVLRGDFLKKRIRTLSGGHKQRVSIARALTMEPKLVIADEPTSMLDPSSCANVLRMLKTLQNLRGFAMLIITHDLEGAAKISDRIYLLKNEKLTRVRPSDYVTANFSDLLK